MVFLFMQGACHHSNKQIKGTFSTINITNRKEKNILISASIKNVPKHQIEAILI
jgi:hypothetical protein